MKKMKIVVKIGGSVSIGEAGPNFSYFSRLLPVLRWLKKKNQIVIAIGGGKLTRAYAKNIEPFQLDNRENEEIFIELIRANVRLLAAVLKMKPIFSLENVEKNTSGVIGGIAPGRSTDANAAMAARKIGADIFIKMTDVDGVYNKDPKKFKDAKLLHSARFSDLARLAPKGRPNKYGVLDKLAVKTLAAGKIKTVVINGKKPENVLRVLRGEKIGTQIG